jgi:hypothetical protein
MIASSYPQFSWLMPQAEPVPQSAPDVSSRTASFPDQRQSNGVTLDLDAVRQAIDRIATSIASSQEQITSNTDRSATNQEQVMRSLDRITANQEQMTHEITKLQEIEQSNSSRNLVPSPRPVTSAPVPIPRPVVSAPKALPRPASAPAAQPLSQASQEPTVR